MNRGQHRAPKTRKTRPLRRIAAGISIAAAAVTGGILADDLAATPPQDTTWGAPDGDTTWGAPAPDTGTVTPQDTTWG